MRCRDARQRLNDQQPDEQAVADLAALQEHLARCPDCRTYQEQQQRLSKMLLQSPLPPVYCSISTERIMQAIRQQQRITSQLEDLRSQQRSRLARLGPVGPLLAALTFFLIGSIPLLLFAIILIQPDVLVKALMVLGDVADVFMILAQYLRTGLTLITADNWLLSGVAFALIVLAGMWLRLMRTPQEAQ